MTLPAETIAAVATPPGRGGVGIVRVSGPAAAAIARGVTGRLPEPRRATYCTFRDALGRAVDQGIALYFPSPRSFTGEEVLELQGHGGPVVMDLLLGRVLALGARLARPGEFSERAFLNDRLDLAQAEAVADLIDADSELAARAALHSLQGEFSGRARALAEAVTALRVYVEAGIDFADEELDLLGDGEVTRRAAELRRRLGELRAAARQGTILREGMTVVIAGRPNAGKSSLLNRLAGRESAIVTELPGTTRDVLRERIAIDGMPLHVIDTAGLREAADRVEQEGIRRAWAEIERADRLLLVVDDAVGIAEEERAIVARLPQRLAVTVVRNKIDLTGRGPGRGEGELGEEIRLSAREGIGIDLLRDHLKEAMGYRVGSGGGEGLFTARRRHLEALERADSHLGVAAERTAQGAGELVAEELRLAHRALGEITGAVTSDQLLGRIFSAFCIGK